MADVWATSQHVVLDPATTGTGEYRSVRPAPCKRFDHPSVCAESDPWSEWRRSRRARRSQRRGDKRRAAGFVGAAIILSVLGAGAAYGVQNRLIPIGVAGGEAAAAPSLQPAQVLAVAHQVDTSVVDVVATHRAQHTLMAGTGMVITASGEILTNNHVITGASSITVTQVTTGQKYRARVIGTDPQHDVAVLQVLGAHTMTPISLGDSSTLANGVQVIAIGNAGGVGGLPSVVYGNVLHQNVTVLASENGPVEELSGIIETDAPTARGDSGGPVVDASGRVVGMTAAGSLTNQNNPSDPADRSYAIPIDTALTIAHRLGG